MAVGGVDTYYDYDDREWKYRRLGGGPVRPKRAHTETPVRKAALKPKPQSKKAEAADS